MPNSGDNNNKERTIETLKSALIGILFLISGWGYNAQTKLEERLFTISTTTMSQAAGQQLEDRINRNMEAKFNEMNSRLDLILRLVRGDKEK